MYQLYPPHCQAAEYGKSLLESNLELEASTEQALQDKHDAGLRLQVKCGVEKALLGEVEALRDQLRQQEQEATAKETQEQERWERREEVWRARVVEAEAAQASTEVQCSGLREQLELAEQQLREQGDLSMGGDKSLSGELQELQTQQLQLVQERQGLQQEVARLRAEAEGERAVARREGARAEAVVLELEEARCEVVSWQRQVERVREEVAGLEQQLEVERQDQGGEGRGNSLFSEVEDRREKVEHQLRVYEEKYVVLKENYDVKMAQLQKTKLHNAALLGLVGGRGGEQGQVARLEDLLEQERSRSRVLGERLDCLEKAGEGARLEQVVVFSAKEGEVEGQHTTSPEYQYLASLVKDLQEKERQVKLPPNRQNPSLPQVQKQLQQQLRQNLDDSDKLREMTRKMNLSEQSLQKSRADNYSLRMNIDELKTKNGDQKVMKKETKKIVEMLKFDKKEEVVVSKVEEEVFVLKETVLIKENSMKGDRTKEETKHKMTADPENKENLTVEEKPKRKGASFADTVEVLDGEGGVEATKLKEEPQEKVQGRRQQPRGRRQGGASNTVRVAEQEVAQECKQQ